MLADVIQPCSRASRVARFTEWAIPASSAWITRRRASRGYPSRSWVVVMEVGAWPRARAATRRQHHPSSSRHMKKIVFKTGVGQTRPGPLARFRFEAYFLTPLPRVDEGSRADHQAGPQGHATTRRMRAPP